MSEAPAAAPDVIDLPFADVADFAFCPADPSLLAVANEKVVAVLRGGQIIRQKAAPGTRRIYWSGTLLGIEGDRQFSILRDYQLLEVPFEVRPFAIASVGDGRFMAIDGAGDASTIELGADGPEVRPLVSTRRRRPQGLVAGHRYAAFVTSEGLALIDAASQRVVYAETAYELLAIDRAGTRLAGFTQGTLYVHDLGGDEPRQLVKLSMALAVDELRWSDSGRWLVAKGEGRYRLYDLARPAGARAGEGGTALQLAFRGDDLYVRLSSLPRLQRAGAEPASADSGAPAVVPVSARPRRLWQMSYRADAIGDEVELDALADARVGDRVLLFLGPQGREWPGAICEVIGGRREPPAVRCRRLLALPRPTEAVRAVYRRDIESVVSSTSSRPVEGADRQRVGTLLQKLYADGLLGDRAVALLDGNEPAARAEMSPEEPQPSPDVAPADNPRRRAPSQPPPPTQPDPPALPDSPSSEPTVGTASIVVVEARAAQPASRTVRVEVRDGDRDSITVRWNDVVYRGQPGTRPIELANDRDAGPALYRAIMEAAPADGIDRRPGDGLRRALDEQTDRILLDLAPELQGLPWEAMTGSRGSLGLDSARPLARWIACQPTNAPLPDVLDIVCAVANPTTLGDPSNDLVKGLAPIDVAQEVARFRTATQPLVEAGLARVRIARATADGLSKALPGAHVLHLIAHGFWHPAFRRYGLVLEDAAGAHEIRLLDPPPGPFHSLREVFGAGDSLRLVLLGACESGRWQKENERPLVSLGARLAERIGAVVAMQDQITAEAVGHFALHFYAALGRTGLADRAAAAGRHALRQAWPAHDRQWSFPAIYIGTDPPQVVRPRDEPGLQADRLPAAPRMPAGDPQVAAAARTAGVDGCIATAIASAVAAALAARDAARVADPAATFAGGGGPAIVQARGELEAIITRGAVDLDPAALAAEVGPAGKTLRLPPHVLDQTVAALEAGKHVVFIGPPGNGKTTLANVVCEHAVARGVSAGTVNATASADWSSADTIGALLPAAGGAVEFRTGLVLRSILAGKWLVLDELNRAEIDKAFGELFTILSGQPITIPFGRRAGALEIHPASAWKSAAAEHVVVHPTWRILATMNVYDRSFLFGMSLAFMRRFAFVDVELPEDYGALLDDWLAQVPVTPADRPRVRDVLAALVDHAGPCRTLCTHRAIGPAIMRDVVRYIGARAGRGGAWDHACEEAIALYVVPQLEGLTPDQVIPVERELRTALTTLAPAVTRRLVAPRVRTLYPHVEDWTPA